MLRNRIMNSIAWCAVVTVPSEYNRINLVWIQYGNSHTDRLSVESSWCEEWSTEGCFVERSNIRNYFKIQGFCQQSTKITRT
jgi:hypothetical protein